MSKKIPELPAGSQPVDGDLLECSQSDVSNKISFAQIKAWVLAFITQSPWTGGSGTNAVHAGTSTTSAGNNSLSFGATVATNGNNSFSLGTSITSDFDGAFTVSDSQLTSVNPTANNQFVGTFQNGYSFNVSPSVKGIDVDSSGNLKAYHDVQYVHSGGTYSVNLKAPTSLGATVNFQLPSADGNTNNVMITNGSGALSFTGTPTLQKVIFSASSTTANALTYDSTNLNFGSAPVVTQSGSVTAGNFAKWSANGQINDGGTLGEAALKDVSNDTYSTVASVGSATGTNTFAFFIDANGTLGNPTNFNTISLSNPVSLGNTMSATRFTLHSVANIAGNAFTRASTGVLYWSASPVALQSGSITAGNVAVWNSDGVLSDGGSPGTSAINLVILTSTTVATYTPSANTRFFIVEGVGGGGAGGGALTANNTEISVGSGGGAGAYFRYVLNGTFAASYEYQCGAGGTPVTGANGGDGGTTTFGLPGGGGNIASAGGGKGGITVAGNVTPVSISLLGGLGGDLSIGIGSDGEDGGNTLRIVDGTSINGVISGKGGSSPFEKGGKCLSGSITPNEQGVSGSKGSGGGGAIAHLVVGGASNLGGYGGAGVIYITEFIG